MSKQIALVGNPNVGKSSIFNLLTGLKQHTGNWPGKTVTSAWGSYMYQNEDVNLIDLPGCYSLFPHSQEEEIASEFIMTRELDGIVVVCDATCLKRNLIFLLQIISTQKPVIVCLNLMDEAKKKGIKINVEQLSKCLHVPIVVTSAKEKQGMDALKDAIASLTTQTTYAYEVKLPRLQPHLEKMKQLQLHHPHMKMSSWLCYAVLQQDHIAWLDSDDHEHLQNYKMKYLASETDLQSEISQAFHEEAMNVFHACVSYPKKAFDALDRRLDRIFTSKKTGIPVMVCLLFCVFWLTIAGANIPSQMLSDMLFSFQDHLLDAAHYLNLSPVFYEPMIFGVYRVLAWVVSVMLPPMAIFFPLFTLLEDFGYLPRVAYNLDHCFKKCCACGKQALTMCMGFGCNAAGVIGCRIIDSPRERLIAILTNNFVPCNGRFPTIIAMISMFFVGTSMHYGQSFFAAIILTGIIICSVGITFAVSKLLSLTILKGSPSSFTLELPPYRKPNVTQVVVRSIFDRTLQVLGRAVIVAAPAGLMIWILANITVNEMTILQHCIQFFDPFARAIGLDGVILMAFVLGIPANEIVIPIMIMSYLSTGMLVDMEDFIQLKQLLVNNGWTILTAINLILFSLMHWPCATTLLTIKKETQSLKWTILAFLIPTILGISVCFLTTWIYRFFIFVM